MRFIRKTLRAMGIAWQALGVAAVILFILFAAWRIPREKVELAEWARADLDDGPHVFWLDASHVRVARAKFDRAAARYDAFEEVIEVKPGALWLKTQEGELPLDPPGGEPAEPEGHPEKIAAVGDVHGQHQTFTRLLNRLGVVDARENWSWGANHLVLSGDVFDKGPGATRALWLIKKLERQARQAGGRVHYVLGNHEHLALRGESVRPAGPSSADSLGMRPQDLFGTNTELGRWIRRHGVATRVNGWLFVHGGISDAVLKENLSLEEMNRLARLRLDPAALAAASNRERQLSALLGSGDGPTGYRGYFDLSYLSIIKGFRGTLGDSPAGPGEAERALQRYGSKRMVIGHTYVRRIRPMFRGKVIAICRMQGGPDLPGPATDAEALLVEGDRPYRVGWNGEREALN